MDDTIENCIISNLKQAEEFLKQHKNNLILNLEFYIDDLFVKRESWSDFSHIENDIKTKLCEIYYGLEIEDSNLLTISKISFECVFFNRLHDFLIPLVYQNLKEDDEYFFSKSTELCNDNITAEQLGAPENYAVPLLAAVVELSNLDKYKSPLEKLHCLCTTYDLIFAELKTVLIDIISKFSVTESEIPVINNSDIIPILATIIIKSKLVHLPSNFYYIEAFIGCLEEKDNMRHVLNSFKEAIERIKFTTKESLKPTSEKVCRDLDLIKLIKITSEINTKFQDIKGIVTPLDTQMLRITDLIVTSTNENNPVL